MIETLISVLEQLDTMHAANMRKVVQETDLEGIGPVAKKLGRVQGIYDARVLVARMIEKAKEGDSLDDFEDN